MGKKILLWYFVLLVSLSSLSAQTKGRFGVELGSGSAGLYELSLGKRWTVSARAGVVAGLGYLISTGGSSLDFSGFTPFVGMSARWDFSPREGDRAYRRGAYLGLDYQLEMDALTFLGGIEPGTVGAEVKLTQAFVLPSFGWVFPLGDSSYIRTSAGLSISREYHKTTYGSFWTGRNGFGVLPIHLELVYGLRF